MEFMQESLKKTPEKRMHALDAFRGITITMMILVNNPGSWAHMYEPLKHAEWNGWTPTDFIFPFFIFIMGISIVLAFTKKIEARVKKPQLYQEIFSRTCKLFALGLFLNLFTINLLAPDHHWVTDTLFNVRVMGVLQRLAIVYAITSLLFLTVSNAALIAISLSTLIFYWLAMVYFPFSTTINGVTVDLTGTLEHGKNFAAYVDSVLIGAKHVYFNKDVLFPYDPEGLFSTIPAIATCISGVLTGLYLQQNHPLPKQIITLSCWGLLFLLAGQLMDYSFPINKTIWSPSYVIFMTGMALLFLSGCMYLIDYKNIKSWSYPFTIFGEHAITFFMFSGILARLILIITVGDLRLRDWLYLNIYSPVFGKMMGSLMFSVIFLLISYAVLNWLSRKKLVLKV
jgi:predicted acyltransferase